MLFQESAVQLGKIWLWTPTCEESLESGPKGWLVRVYRFPDILTRHAFREAFNLQSLLVIFLERIFGNWPAASGHPRSILEVQVVQFQYLACPFRCGASKYSEPAFVYAPVRQTHD